MAVRFTLKHFDYEPFKAHLTKYYTKITNNTYKESKYGFGQLVDQYESYAISPFLQAKLQSYANVKPTLTTRVWIVTNETKFVVKIHYNKQEFDKVVAVQPLLYNAGIGCRLIETWINSDIPEYFTISEYGGDTVANKYNWNVAYALSHRRDPSMPALVYAKIDETIRKLKELGYEHHDVNECNFVEDENGIVKMIDYDSIEAI